MNCSVNINDIIYYFQSIRHWIFLHNPLSRVQCLAVDEVCKLLKELGLDNCVSIIKKEGMGGRELLNYRQDEFMSLLIDNGFRRPDARTAWGKLPPHLKPAGYEASRGVSALS